MLAALGVGKVGTVVLVDGKTQSALERTDMIAEAIRCQYACSIFEISKKWRNSQVRVLVEVNRLESKLPETLATVLVAGGERGNTSAAHLGANTPFVGHDL